MPRTPPDPPDHYYEARLLPAQRRTLISLLEGRTIAPALLSDILARVKAAPRYDLPPHEIDWPTAERKARERGETLADYIFDNPPRKKEK